MMPKVENGKRILQCSCGYKQVGEMKFSSAGEKKQELGIASEGQDIRAIIEIKCPQCNHPKAHYWEIQMRAADEPPSQFFQCVACKHTWRKK